MNALFIEESKATPKVIFNPDGELFIQGRSLPEDPVGFYVPILNWIKNCSCEQITLTLKLEYLNSSSIKQFFALLQLINENPKIITKTVNWYYEEDDEEWYDIGKEFETISKINFNYFEYAEIYK
jgi:hypothetical protein